MQVNNIGSHIEKLRSGVVGAGGGINVTNLGTTFGQVVLTVLGSASVSDVVVHIEEMNKGNPSEIQVFLTSSPITPASVIEEVLSRIADLGIREVTTDSVTFMKR